MRAFSLSVWRVRDMPRFCIGMRFVRGFSNGGRSGAYGAYEGTSGEGPSLPGGSWTECSITQRTSHGPEASSTRDQQAAGWKGGAERRSSGRKLNRRPGGILSENNVNPCNLPPFTRVAIDVSQFLTDCVSSDLPSRLFMSTQAQPSGNQFSTVLRSELLESNIPFFGNLTLDYSQTTMYLEVLQMPCLL